jgi:hypothetical protein
MTATERTAPPGTAPLLSPAGVPRRTTYTNVPVTETKIALPLHRSEWAGRIRDSIENGRAAVLEQRNIEMKEHMEHKVFEAPERAAQRAEDNGDEMIAYAYREYGTRLRKRVDHVLHDYMFGEGFGGSMTERRKDKTKKYHKAHRRNMREIRFLSKRLKEMKAGEYDSVAAAKYATRTDELIEKLSTHRYGEMLKEAYPAEFPESEFDGSYIGNMARFPFGPNRPMPSARNKLPPDRNFPDEPDKFPSNVGEEYTVDVLGLPVQMRRVRKEDLELLNRSHKQAQNPARFANMNEYEKNFWSNPVSVVYQYRRPPPMYLDAFLVSTERGLKEEMARIKKDNEELRAAAATFDQDNAWKKATYGVRPVDTRTMDNPRWNKYDGTWFAPLLKDNSKMLDVYTFGILVSPEDSGDAKMREDTLNAIGEKARFVNKEEAGIFNKITYGVGACWMVGSVSGAVAGWFIEKFWPRNPQLSTTPRLRKHAMMNSAGRVSSRAGVLAAFSWVTYYVLRSSVEWVDKKITALRHTEFQHPNLTDEERDELVNSVVTMRYQLHEGIAIGSMIGYMILKAKQRMVAGGFALMSGAMIGMNAYIGKRRVRLHAKKAKFQIDRMIGGESNRLAYSHMRPAVFDPKHLYAKTKEGVILPMPTTADEWEAHYGPDPDSPFLTHTRNPEPPTFTPEQQAATEEAIQTITRKAPKVSEREISQTLHQLRKEHENRGYSQQ